MPTFERREIIPCHRRLAGQTLTLAPFDRREIYTELDYFCRCYHSPEAISRHRGRSRLAVRQDCQREPRSADLTMSGDEQSHEFSGDALPVPGENRTD